MFGKKEQSKDTFLHRKLGPTLASVVLFILEVTQIVIISAAIILPIRFFLIQPFYVKGESMEPNFYDNEYLIIDEISYRFREPERGEIVVFRYPRNPSEFFIKRVVGLPGETIEISDGRVTVINEDFPDGRSIDEPYTLNDFTAGSKRVVLNPDEYFVLGDNRDASYDSRRFGPIRKDAIVGRVWVRGLPLTKINLFDAPDYNL
ncbi:MAG: hypothetical protein ACD_76C00131G0002 [uncultured bacterium]|nr:MAG: hypothetical protein ACD_76C00131G0002 [uncultured bacterium]HBD05612.1 signal peptidase I [Candidatus Uhrbacteria bacterium]